MSEKKKNKTLKSSKAHPPHKKFIRETPQDPHGKKVWVALAGILAITFFVYFKATRYGYVWDDNLYIHDCNYIKDIKWVNIRLIFTEFYASNYHPLTLLSYAIELKLFKNPATFIHLNNIFIHLINTLLVFVLIKKISPKNAWIGLITAAFFAVHPMHVESVAWIAERKDVLYSFFFLMSLITYSNYLKSGKTKHLLISGLLFILSSLSKSAAVILPLVLLLMDYYCNRKFTLRMVLEKAPLFVISLVFGILAIWSQKGPIHYMAPQLSFAEHVAVISHSFISYVFKAIIPVNMSAVYAYPKGIGNALPLAYYISIPIAAILLFFVGYSFRKARDIFFGSMFFIITIILVLQFVQVGAATMADRYTYIPYIGLFFIVGNISEKLTSKGNSKLNYKVALPVIIIAGFIAFSIITFDRINIWKTDETLFSDVIKKHPQCGYAYYNRGYYYLKSFGKEGQTNFSNAQTFIRKSVDDFDLAIKNDPNYADAYNNRGYAKFLLNDFHGALQDYNNAVRLKPHDSLGLYNRGVIKNSLLDFAGAIKDFDQAVMIGKNYGEAYNSRGFSKLQLKDYYGALDDFNKSIALNPQNALAISNRGVIKFNMNDYRGALEDFNKALELNPRDANTAKNRDAVTTLLGASPK